MRVVLLTDHLHAIWSLPAGDTDYSKRWAFFKRSFTAAWLLANPHDAVGGDERWQRRRSVWQPRFMEHVIRDETDRDRHFDYLHYNPVRHGLVTCPHAWPWSSFDRCVRQGIYSTAWSCACHQPSTPPNLGWAEKYEME